ncbi:MAG: Asp-tRNA(Asn)/Glu-tRNA(Gln) amidotransferase subunit GatA [Candidatus Liptonbacteria bacterium]|nr:Asp-tRNA(Asn)/Glu-tRNA(Gln) amidotransferase subunit GatA [Candidatus Liptonbacteria bacterium]
MTPLKNLTIKKFNEGLVKKDFSAAEIADAFLREISRKDGEIGAYLSINEEGALREAEAVDASLAKGEKIGPFAGVPIAIKDNILIKGLRATAASKILENYTASYDAGIIKKLKNERAVFLGKTNMDEFAMGSSTENSAFKMTKNPHDNERVPGGSSGGSAAAVAADLAVAALGSDTGGSIREPAAFCGVVGLKPTYGAVSRSGLIAMASSLDQIGPITKTVQDSALLFNAIRGQDALDATSTEIPGSENYIRELLDPDLKKIKDLVIGIPGEYFPEELDETTKKSIDVTIKTVQSLGVKFKKISLPNTRYALSCYYIIMPAEVSSNLARFDGIRYGRKTEGVQPATNLKDIYFKTRGEGFGNEAKRRIILGTFVLSSGYYDSYYKKAQQVRRLIKNDFENALKEVDAIMTPVTPGPAFKIGEKTEDPLTMYLSDIFTIPANLAGLPAVSIPVREKKEGLPIGFQLIGKAWREPDILGLGFYYEKTTAPELYEN